MPVIRIVRMHIAPDHIDQVRETFREIKHSVRNFPGCHYVALWEDVAQPGHIMTYSIWESEAHLEAYRRSDVFRRNWTLLKCHFAGPPEAWTFKCQDECRYPSSSKSD